MNYNNYFGVVEGKSLYNTYRRLFLIGAAIGAGADLIGGLIGGGQKKSQMRLQQKFTERNMMLQDQYTRNLTRDTPELTAQGMVNAGLSKAGMQGTGSAQTIGSTPSAPQIPSSSPMQEAMQGVGSILASMDLNDSVVDKNRADASKADADSDKVRQEIDQNNQSFKERLDLLRNEKKISDEDYFRRLKEHDYVEDFLNNKKEAQDLELNRSRLNNNMMDLQIQRTNLENESIRIKNDMSRVELDQFQKECPLMLAKMKAEIDEIRQQTATLAKQGKMYDAQSALDRIQATYQKWRMTAEKQLQPKVLQLMDKRIQLTQNLAWQSAAQTKYIGYQSDILMPDAVRGRYKGNQLEKYGAARVWDSFTSTLSSAFESVSSFAPMFREGARYSSYNYGNTYNQSLYSY